jgi:hypothetical protein
MTVMPLNPPLPPSSAEPVVAELIWQIGVLAADPAEYRKRVDQLRSEREAITAARTAARQEIGEREKSLVEEGKRQAKLRAEADARIDQRESRAESRETKLKLREVALDAAKAKHEAEVARLAEERAALEGRLARLREVTQA